MNKDKKNAYELNETNQFSNQETVKNMLIINLKHRKDRKEIMTKKLESLSLTNKSYQFVEAINGYELDNNDNDQLEIKELNKDLYIGATFCYSINKIGALKLIQYIKENGVNHGIDYQMKITPGLNVKEIQPQIVFSNWNENGKEIDTDIQNNSETIDFSQFKVNDVLLKEKFVFIQGMDQIGYDVVNSNHTNDINKNMKICLENEELIGFNTLGPIRKSLDDNQKKEYEKLFYEYFLKSFSSRL